MNKILIWTYKPFGEHKVNSAKEFVSKVSMSNVKIVILYLNYDLSLLYEEIEKFQPDILLGVGQSFGTEVKVEKKFRNRIKNDNEERIFSDTAFYLSTLPVKNVAEILKVNVSDDAGTHNCNFSSFTLLEKIKKEKKNIRVGFVHVPPQEYFDSKLYLPRFVKMLEFLQSCDLS